MYIKQKRGNFKLKKCAYIQMNFRLLSIKGGNNKMFSRARARTQ